MKKVITKIVMIGVLLSPLSASTDYNLLAEAVEFLIKQTTSLDKKMNKVKSDNEKLFSENKKIKATNKQLKKDIEQIKNCNCRKANLKIRENEKSIKRLKKKHDEDMKKYVIDDNGVISVEVPQKIQATNNIKKIKVPSREQELKLLEQQERLNKYIENRKSNPDASLK